MAIQAKLQAEVKKQTVQRLKLELQNPQTLILEETHAVKQGLPNQGLITEANPNSPVVLQVEVVEVNDPDLVIVENPNHLHEATKNQIPKNPEAIPLVKNGRALKGKAQDLALAENPPLVDLQEGKVLLLGEEVKLKPLQYHPKKERAAITRCPFMLLCKIYI